jgi:hypothetical protein
MEKLFLSDGEGLLAGWSGYATEMTMKPSICILEITAEESGKEPKSKAGRLLVMWVLRESRPAPISITESNTEENTLIPLAGGLSL